MLGEGTLSALLIACTVCVVHRVDGQFVSRARGHDPSMMTGNNVGVSEHA